MAARQLAGRLVVLQHPDAAGVSHVAAEGCGQEPLDEPTASSRLHAGPDSDDVGVVVCPPEAGGVVVPGHGPY
jgi:hypothetical protein